MPWQPTGILFPDAELSICAALRPHLDGQVFVGNAVPNPRRERMVVVNRDGGSNDGVTDQPRIRIRCWAPTKQAATDLARLVVALMPTLVGSGGIVRVDHQSGPYEVPDESGAHQRLALFEIRTQGAPL